MCFQIPSRGTSLLHSIFHQNIVDPGETCPGPNITQYQLSFQTGSVVNSDNVSTFRCTAGRCSHTFEPPSNPPSSYDSVSVAAENVVGVGAARTCTTQTISELLVSWLYTRLHLLNKFYFNLIREYVFGVNSGVARINRLHEHSTGTLSACVMWFATEPGAHTRHKIC